MKKSILVIIIAALCAGGVIFGFWYYHNNGSSGGGDSKELTEVQKINTMDLAKNYPETPRAVVKLFNRILKAYHGGEDFSDEELKELTGKAWELFDQELQANNGSPANYLASVKAEINDYKNKSRRISQTNVSDSDDVQYLSETNKKTGNKDELAYVSASYFVKEGGSFTNTYEKYVLRKDKDGKWKILVFYQIDKENNTEDE